MLTITKEYKISLKPLVNVIPLWYASRMTNQPTMTMAEWLEQLPLDWADTYDFDSCAICHDDEVYDFGVCVACAEEMNENENDGLWYL